MGQVWQDSRIAAALNRSDDYLPVCFIDDKESLKGQSLSGLKIYSPEKKPKRNLGNLALKRFYLRCHRLDVRVRKKLLPNPLIRQCQNYGVAWGNPVGRWASPESSDIREVDIIDF